MTQTNIIPPIRDPGYRLKANEDWNQVLSVLRILNGGDLTTDGGGIKTYFCAVTSAGPNADTDFTDARYWVKRQYLNNTDSDYMASISNHAALYDSTTSNYWLCATNLYEITTGNTHNINTKGKELVQVFRTLDSSASVPTFHHYFWKTVPHLYFGKVRKVYASDHTSWVDFKTDGWQTHCSVKRCKADGTNSDNSTLWIKLTEVPTNSDNSWIGYSHVVSTNTIGYFYGDNTEQIPGAGAGSFFNGYVVENAGKDGTVLDIRGVPNTVSTYNLIWNGDEERKDWDYCVMSEITVVTDYRISDIYFQKKTRKIYVEVLAAESDWHLVATGSNC